MGKVLLLWVEPGWEGSAADMGCRNTVGPAAPHRANRHPMSPAPTAPLQNCVQALLALYCLILQLIKAGRGCRWQDPFVTTWSPS